MFSRSTWPLRGFPTGSRSALCAVWLLVGAPILGAETLESLRAQSRGETYEEPTLQDLRSAELLFAKLLCPDQDRKQIDLLCDALEWETLELQQGGTTFLIVKERAGKKRGWGFYAFRIDRRTGVALEAPHALDDARTGTLADLLFRETPCAAAAWSTVPRETPIGRTGSTADLAHIGDSVYHSFTRAFISAFPRGIIIQLHGFEATARATEAGAASAAILSDGTRSPRPWMSELVTCLEAALRAKVSLYPRDVSELGGTTNTHGRLLRKARHAGFVHIELGAEARRELCGDAEIRTKSWRCIPEAQP